MHLRVQGLGCACRVLTCASIGFGIIVQGSGGFGICEYRLWDYSIGFEIIVVGVWGRVFGMCEPEEHEHDERPERHRGRRLLRPRHLNATKPPVSGPWSVVASTRIRRREVHSKAIRKYDLRTAGGLLHQRQLDGGSGCWLWGV